MRMLPRPRTNVLGALFFTLLPFELPSTNDGRDGSAALDVVMIEGQIHVDDDERDEEPQKEMMPVANAFVSTQDGNDPVEHARQPRVAHAGVECKAGDRLGDERDKSEEVDEGGEGVVAGGDG